MIIISLVQQHNALRVKSEKKCTLKSLVLKGRVNFFIQEGVGIFFLVVSFGTFFFIFKALCSGHGGQWQRKYTQIYLVPSDFWIFQMVIKNSYMQSNHVRLSTRRRRKRRCR